MFLQTISEHQGHILIRIAVVLGLLLGFLFLFGLFNRKKTKTKADEPEILNFEERKNRKSKNRWRKGGRRK